MILLINQITIAKVSLLIYNYEKRDSFKTIVKFLVSCERDLKCIQNHSLKRQLWIAKNFDVNLSKKVIAFQHTPARYTYVNQFKFYFWHIWKFINTWQVSRTFPAFKSRCIMPCLCKCTNPWHIPRQTYNEFLTCFHESWIYETWIPSMKFAVYFDLW